MRIPDPGVKKALYPGSATLLGGRGGGVHNGIPGDESTQWYTWGWEYTIPYLGMRVHESEDLPGQLQLDVQLSQVEMVAQRQQALHTVYTVYTRQMIKFSSTKTLKRYIVIREKDRRGQ
jgi:hypothetical protein